MSEDMTMQLTRGIVEAYTAQVRKAHGEVRDLRVAVDERDRMIRDRDEIIRRQANDLGHQRSEIAFLREQLEIERLRAKRPGEVAE